MKYPATITPYKEISGYIVTFRDIPEAITQGNTPKEAIFSAQDALLTTIGFYFEDRRVVPLPSKPKQGDHLVELPVSVFAKVLLLNEMFTQGMKRSVLAKKLGVSQSEINRLIDLKHTTKIDRIAQALNAMGKSLALSIR